MANGPFFIFLISLLPFPLSYCLNTQKWMQEPRIIFIVGAVVLLCIVLIPYISVRRMKKPDPVLYFKGLFMFSSMIDLIIALEADGIVREFMTFYLKEGEPYLWTPYGTMINYWDGIVHYGLSVWMLYCAARGKNYRKAGLYWAGSIINSLLVLVPGSVIGKFGVKYAILLNLPYFFVPLWIGYTVLNRREPSGRPRQGKAISTRSILSRPVDLLFVVYFVFAMGVDLFRGFIALGCNEPLMMEYLQDHEPYILDPTGYSKVQMLINMMYLVPYYGFCIYGLFNPGAPWMSDWALIYAGLTAQGQFSHIGGSVHPRTPSEFQVPARSHSQNVFWLINISMFVMPQLFALVQNLNTNRRKQE